ncbi:MAG: hypothetical protein JW827_12355, partial [Spirochaetes bacterium]|nr:hypothetical protein [Spirochaetota bacterium]
QYNLMKILFFRAGYKIGLDTGNLSLGAGVHYGVDQNTKLKLNYSFNLNSQSSEFGHLHCLNLEVGFLKGEAEKKEEKKEYGMKEEKIEKVVPEGKIPVTVAKFKNLDDNRTLEYLKEKLALGTLDYIDDEADDMKAVNIMRMESPSLEVLEKAGIQYISGGSFSKKGDILKIDYFIVDVKTRKKVFDDSLDFNTKTERMNDLYENLGKKIVEKIRSLKK